LIDDLRALLEEADIKIAEISKDQYEFKRDVNAGVRAREREREEKERERETERSNAGARVTEPYLNNGGA
jgi:hypothetical protein